MRTQRRNKKTIYLCQKEIKGNLIFYKKPIAIKENCHSVNIDADLISMGMEYPSRIRIKTDLKAYVKLNDEYQWIPRTELYHVGDRVYVFTKPPKEHDSLCKTADYEVELDPHVGITVNQQEIMLIKLSGSNRNSIRE